eukprot:TRINITY_DN1121_c2_g1_i1.p1 TRINITY_DN1121_c2_g1~~TRINITY_DN1121_c2_g1_i1.p1  ORF type:complete len:199 (+),score=31.17 TRINITY_DN1121_c2_g1_i1:49-645(+)
MARGNAKRNAHINKKRMALFKQITIGINVALAAYYLYNGQLLNFRTIVMFAFFGVQEYFSLQMLERHGKPSYDSFGNVVECVNLSDPKDLGMHSLLQDLLWICWAVETTIAFTWYGWIIYLIVPTYGFHKVWKAFGPRLKDMAEKYAAGQNPMPTPGKGQVIQGQSRKEKRAAGRKEVKDAKNAAKAALKERAPAKRK